MGFLIDAKAITIPQGDVTKIVSNGVTIWEKPSGVTYYYELFDQHTAITGGWTLETPGTAALTFLEDGRMELYSGNVYGTGQNHYFASHATAVDLTNITTLYITADKSNGGGCYFGIVDDTAKLKVSFSLPSGQNVSVANQALTEYSLDVSGFTGYWFLVLQANRSQSNRPRFRVTEIRGE